MNTFNFLYNSKIIPEMIKNFNYKNIHQIPKLLKIQISTSFGLLGQSEKFLNKAINEISLISGQYPKITKAKKSIANFKIHKGMILGLYVTLRKYKMYMFLYKFINSTLPRIKNFNGFLNKNIDNQGNLNFGIKDKYIFPEITLDDYDENNSNSNLGYTISFINSAKNKKEGLYFFNLLKFPFI